MRLDNMGKSDREKYLDLLAEKYPEREDICREIINLSAIIAGRSSICPPS